MKKTFDRIYRRNGWNGVESLSGPGSGSAPTKNVVAAIAQIVERYDVRSVLDVGCGDGFWTPDLPGYIGVDASTYAIATAQERHPDRDYRVIDASRDELPPVDLVIVRDVLQHLSIKDALKVIWNAREAGDLLLASTYRGGSNENIRTGHYRYGPDLEAAPFYFPPPQVMIFDGYGYEHPDEVRDPGKHLGLWWA